ncbi:hypothetical protein LJ753_05570 [Arthrobacter sp. zg-Y20]|uniref:hypothetical protein n=1 Tax=unclassified Arthrobacter TaxID=235627 RepID=UPI001D157939|nr:MULTISPECIES: hypothetical protein [unclassified Arthrobacter]MCC3275336.1 hypothetical protein [Arthrobacter sp. zg-Y20]MDK1315494.1 hypothetical protein [Arthrobacter sp. zg.Y20]WIB05910.1 hypothetical protein QNO06_15545 [Arthrobacter sp. zg-Y20]
MINALEGFRDVKASLASGALVLIGIWILFAGHFSSPGGDGSLWADIQQGISFVGMPAAIAGATFLAYLVGIIFSFDRLLFMLLDRTYSNFSSLSVDSQARLEQKVRAELDELTFEFDKTYEYLSNATGLSGEVTTEDKRKLLREWGEDHPPEVWANGTSEVIRDRFLRHFLDEMKGSMDLVALNLHSANAVSADRYEKASSEASFRGAIAFPILFVAVAISIRLSAEHLYLSTVGVLGIGLVAVIAIVGRAREKRVEAAEELAKAVSSGLVPPPGCAELRRRLEEKKSLGLGLGI